VIVTPAIIALISGILIAIGMTLYASATGVRIIRKWDLGSGSEAQLELERKTYLISTILAYVMGFELFSLFLFIYAVDKMHTLFVGAMCAAGTLFVNSYGYPVLLTKLAAFVLCGIWLVVNYADNLGYDYPLIRAKYKFLLAIAALMLLEGFLLLAYFGTMRPDIITSCCGTLFSAGSTGIAGDIASLPAPVAAAVYFAGAAAVTVTGLRFYLRGKGVGLFAILSLLLFLFSLVSVISFISVYYYELPTHHCPFCLLQREYHYIGYPLYLFLFAATICGVSAGAIDRYKSLPSIAEKIPLIQKKLCLAAVAGFVVFSLLAAYPMIFSDFKITGY
jgi:hypothetical protein